MQQNSIVEQQQNNNNNKNDIRFTIQFFENVDFFDSNMKIFFNKNVHIIIVDRHTYYRDVFFFIDKLKNLKKNSFNFKIKKYIFDYIKNDVFN